MSCFRSPAADAAGQKEMLYLEMVQSTANLVSALFHSVKSSRENNNGRVIQHK